MTAASENIPANIVFGTCLALRARANCRSRILSRVFAVEERDRVQRQILGWAAADERIVAGAVVGSLAHQPGDQYSDLDLTFGVRDDCPISEVLEDWTRTLIADFEAVRLFDLPAGGALYRVFLLPGCLQLDLSFAPASTFGAMGPQFRLLFGTAIDKPFPAPPDPQQLFGYGVHHAVRGRVCIERTRYWQAEYWISGVRDHALTMACARLGLPAHYGRGFDSLPDAIRTAAVGALVHSADRADLLQALRHATNLLLAEGALASVCAPRLVSLLSEFVPID
jgi:hypothetical protein